MGQKKLTAVQLGAGDQYFLHGLRRLQIAKVDYYRRFLPEYAKLI